MHGYLLAIPKSPPLENIIHAAGNPIAYDFKCAPFVKIEHQYQSNLKVNDEFIGFNKVYPGELAFTRFHKNRG